jgi:hypothetical protein
MSCNIERELIQRAQDNQSFAIKVDNPLMFTSLSVSLAYARYIYKNHIENEMRMCKPLPTHSTGEDV